MENEYVKEFNIKDKNEEDKNQELLYSILTTKKKLEEAHRNFEFAQDELIDYYSYNIKANQAKLDYLIKLAKTRGLAMSIDIQKKFDIVQDAGWKK